MNNVYYKNQLRVAKEIINTLKWEKIKLSKELKNQVRNNAILEQENRQLANKISNSLIRNS